MSDDIKADIISAQNENDWSSCIKLCRIALSKENKWNNKQLDSFKLSLALSLLSEGDESGSGFDEAVGIYKKMLSETKPGTEKWAQLQKNLGYAYSSWLMPGNRDDNLAKAIKHYKDSLIGYEKARDKETYANISAEIGYAYKDLEKGSLVENCIKASKYFNDALSVFSKVDYPIENKEISNALKQLKKDHSSADH